MKAIIFNSSLKSSPKLSNTQKVIDLVQKEFKDNYDVDCQTVFLRDYRIAPGVGNSLFKYILL